MTAQFPTAIVSTSNIPDALPLSTLSANNHAGKHNDLRDEIIAIETKIGATGSVVNTTLEFKTKNVTAGDQAIGATQTVSVSNKTLVSPKVTVGSDAVGDVLYNSSGATGVQSRLALGANGQVLTSNGTLPYWNSPSGANVNYIADSGAANAYVAVLTPALAAYTAGVLVQFKATNANTTASTVNVNGLGVKTIKKLGGATDLASGDIASGMIVQLEYDGTNFVMLNPVANAPLLPTGDGSGLTNITNPAVYKLGATTYNLTTASGTQTIAHGLGKTPKYIRMNWVASIADSATLTNRFRGSGFYNGTTIVSTNEGTVPGGSGTLANYNTSTSTSAIILYSDGGGGTDRSQTAVPTFDATNITLTWTKSAVSPAATTTILITWEAFA